MLRTNSSIANLSHQQSSSSLLMALVNQRPKSSQKSESQKRQPSAKSHKPTYKLVTSSLCSPLPQRVEKPDAVQKTNETLKPTEFSSEAPQQSTRNLELHSDKKTTKKPSFIQRTLFGQSAAALGIKQKTVKLTKDSRSSSKQFEDPLPEQNENTEASQKLELLINKYKNTSYFKPDALHELDCNRLVVPLRPDNHYQRLEPKDQPQKEAPKEQIHASPPHASSPPPQSSINKYVTRISKGASVIPMTKQSNRKRMNSPLHNVRRQTKENTDTIFSHRDKKLIRNNSMDKRIVLTQKQSGPQYPFAEFEYYMTLARYFNKDKKQEQQVKALFNHSLKTIQYFMELYQDHLQQSYHALQFCRDSAKPTQEEIQKKVTNLPPSKFAKTIVFDLDETLIHCQESNDDPADVVLTIKFPTGETVEAGINIRPYCREMLQLLSQKYEIIVFTASHECYAQKVLNYIDPDHKWIHHRFFRDSCVVIEDGLHVKDLRVLGNRLLKDMILVDNASYSFCFQLEHGVPILPFYDNPLDKELMFLTTYLLDLMQLDDIQAKNAAHFKHVHFVHEQNIESLIAKL